MQLCSCERKNYNQDIEDEEQDIKDKELPNQETNVKAILDKVTEQLSENDKETIISVGSSHMNQRWIGYDATKIKSRFYVHDIAHTALPN